jgi:hypothetical protein
VHRLAGSSSTESETQFSVKQSYGAWGFALQHDEKHTLNVGILIIYNDLNRGLGLKHLIVRPLRLGSELSQPRV